MDRDAIRGSREQEAVLLTDVVARPSSITLSRYFVRAYSCSKSRNDASHPRDRMKDFNALLIESEKRRIEFPSSLLLSFRGNFSFASNFFIHNF